jgi:hypothetical protein
MEATSPEPSGRPPETPHGDGDRDSALIRARRRLPGWAWPVTKYVLGIAILALAVWVLASHSNELSGLSTDLAHLNWWWVPPAVLVEVGSFVSFATMQRTLLRRGGLVAPRVPMVEMSFAAQAIANSLPGGSAVSAVYGFRWFRRFGADVTLATWALAGTLVASVVSLSLVATGGLALATGEGASLDLVPVIIGAFILTLAVGALFIFERPLFRAVSWAVTASRAVIGRPRGDVEEQIRLIMGWVTAVRLGWRQVVAVLSWGTSNWLLDCACFAMMFEAVHAPIPWKGLLLAYGAGQLAATLPITPGGLGAVEGSITIALVAFGGAQEGTVDAVLMYRLISFWLILVIGWASWSVLAIQTRRGRWSRDLEDAVPEAGALAHHPAGSYGSRSVQPSGVPS